MEGYTRRDEEIPQLLDLIPKEKSKLWPVKAEEEEAKEANHGIAEAEKLELRLGPPDISHAYQSPWKHQSQESVIEELSRPCSSREMVKLQGAEKNAYSPVHANTAQKRVASPVVGWPPIRSFRKNLASSSSCKLTQLDSQNSSPSGKPNENLPKNLFVKINVEGVSIGRKVDLKAHDSYEKLCSAVDELFSSLLAAQCSSSPGGDGIKNMEGRKVITGLLDGGGEYALVYEDKKGDRMLVRDVPWHVFVATVKRLRVLKTSKLPAVSGGNKLGSLSLEAQLK